MTVVRLTDGKLWIHSPVPLTDLNEAGWQDDFDQLIIRGLPISNECIWFHRASRTLIMTDLCQWWVGELPFAARLKDRAAVAESACQILAWPFDRVIAAHNAIIERDGHAAVARAFQVFH
jgi:hypothetical protein